MDQQRADELVACGDLMPAWRPSFLAVPREQFIPDVLWHEVGDVMGPVRRADDPDRWRELALREDSVRDRRGHRVECCAAGSSPRRRPGDTIEIDPEVAAHARKALSEAGFGGVTTITGDGSSGYPPRAPYDRVIATVGSKYVPYPWVEQTRPGGRIVAPSWALDYYGLLLVLTVNEDGTASGHFVDDASFMMLRDQRAYRVRQAINDTGDYEHADISETELQPGRRDQW